jgi:hypothetical protein
LGKKLPARHIVGREAGKKENRIMNIEQGILNDDPPRRMKY